MTPYERRIYRIAITSEPDFKGRQSFSMFWQDRGGIFRPEIGVDGRVVGHRRAQCFRMKLAERIAQLEALGHTYRICRSEEVAEVENRFDSSAI